MTEGSPRAGRPPASERQELLSMVNRCLAVVAALQSDVTTLQRKVDTLEERVSIAAGQYRQRAYAEG